MTGRENLRWVSLYRTWRPRTFADLVGQDAVVKTLTTALETGRLAHAYLFSGPRGSGKTSAAKILSRCQRYAFRRIAIPVMIARMRAIAAAEGIEIDDASLGAIAYRADGGLRDALTMLEQVAAFASGPVDAGTVDAAFGLTGRAVRD